jgi:putative ABC transport system substrate-binding protein
MRRRHFITLVGSVALFPTAAVRAQRGPSSRRVGVLLVGLSPDSKEAQQFRRGLRDAGYIDGRNVIIEWRSAKGDYARVPELIADLVQSGVEVIVMDSTVGTQVAMTTAPTIPIVMALVVDPVGSGLVKSLARPGGNVTGLSMMTTELNSKRLQSVGANERRQTADAPCAKCVVIDQPLDMCVPRESPQDDISAKCILHISHHFPVSSSRS